MAKGNVLLGYARGKVGDLVFSRRNGEQITAARNRHPHNPKTPKQIFQRMKMYAPVNLYRNAIATQFKYAFGDQKANETPFNAFMRKNIGAAPFVSKELAASYAPIPFEAMISDGPIPSVSWQLASWSTSSDSTLNRWGVGINFGSDSTLDNGTVAEFTNNILREYPYLREGDMLTFVNLQTEGLEIDGDLVNYDGVGGFIFQSAQIVLSLSDATLLSSLGLSTVWPQGGSANPDAVALLGGGTTLDVGNIARGGAIIVSRLDGGKVMASTARVSLNQFAGDVYLKMTSETYRNIAALSYGVSTEPMLDPVKDY